jgi:3-isopropylmalate dehydrogenase
MRTYRIAWLPGDGVGVEVMEAARICLDALTLDATYTPGDIGWEFWCREGDALPERTIELLRRSDAGLFGAITSKPPKEAERELAPELQGSGLVYRSPIVRMRQMFDLYTCLRPCKAYPGNPLNYRGGIDLVVFRENTEDLYAGVEFGPVPDELHAVLARLSPPFAGFAGLPGSAYAISCKINSTKSCERIIPGASPRSIRPSKWTTPTSTPSVCGCSRTPGITASSWPRTCLATSSATWPPRWWADWGSDVRATSATPLRSLSRPTAARPGTPVSTR